jgi:hypothetical protein
MPMPDFRNDRTWQEAIALGPHLMELAEAMPATEELGLSWQLRKSMVRLPAAIAVDMHGEGSGRMAEYYRLVATLELIDRVYPALDTAGSRKAVEALGERLAGGDSSDGAPAHDEPDAAERPEPASVPVLEPAPHPSVNVPVQPADEPAAEDPNVHPNSSQ